MRYRTLGRTGLEVSEIDWHLGCRQDRLDRGWQTMPVQGINLQSIADSI